MLVKLPGRLLGKAIRWWWGRRVGPVRVSPPVHGKKALLSYIVTPFSPAAKILHCNYLEAVGMAAVLHAMGYEVHAVDYRCSKTLDYEQYDLIIGFGLPFVNSYAADGFAGKRIVYLTGASPDFSNHAEALRLMRLRQRKGRLLRPRREVYWPWYHAAFNADGVIITGNRWTASTYAHLGRPVEAVPVPHVSPHGMRDGVASKKEDGLIRFIWFSGAGAVHKGLDLVLEAMDEAPAHWHLNVCGPISAESDFLALYREYLCGHKRITYYGFVEPGSPEFHEIMSCNQFVVFPSCSEGGASSVITCMAHGLVPVVTEEASVDADGMELRIEEASPGAVLAAMHRAAALPDDEVKRRSAVLRQRVHEEHSSEAYEAAVAAAIAKILKSASG